MNLNYVYSTKPDKGKDPFIRYRPTRMSKCFGDRVTEEYGSLYGSDPGPLYV